MIFAILPPILFAIYGPTALLAQNLGEIPGSSAGRAVLTSVALGLILVVVLFLLVKDWDKAGMFSSLALLYFFTYGHVYTLVKNLQFGSFVVGRHRFLMPVGLLIMMICIWLVGRIKFKNTSTTRILALMAGTALLFPIFSITRYELRNSNSNEASQIINENPSFTDPPVDSKDLPDIYYIVLDGYARADILLELYDYDNSEFVNYLKDRGFYVADRAASNYSVTLLSIPSSLNMSYVNSLADEYSHDTGEHRVLTEMIRYSQVREFMEREGYRIIAFESGYARSHIYDADYYWKPETVRGPLNNFETLLIDTTALRFVFDMFLKSNEEAQLMFFYPEYEAHRNRIMFTLSKIGEISSMEGNYFVFAHIVAPHPPFVFGSEGQRLVSDVPFTFSDANHYQGSQLEYIKKYKDQLTYLNILVMDAIDEILSNAERPSIIILQGDHGPGAFVEWENFQQSNIRERMSILNAYYFPEGDYEMLYPSISPVNSFRIVFNQHFGTQHELLEERFYFSSFGQLLDFQEVTGQFSD